MSERCKAYTGAGTKVFLISGPQIVNAHGNHGGALKSEQIQRAAMTETV